MKEGIFGPLTPVKMAVGSVIGAAIYVASSSWSASAAWSQTTQKVEDNTARIVKLEKRDDQREQDYISLRESIVTLQVQMRNLTDAVQTVGRDVKDIRTAVR